MTSQKWWADQLQTALSQGDVVTEIPLFSIPTPVPHLCKQSAKQGTVWADSKEPAVAKNGKIHALASGKIAAAVVLSHSCELDKSKPTVLLAQLIPIDQMTCDQATKDQIIAQQLQAMLPLPDVPMLGLCVVSLRNTQSILRPNVDAGVRIASMGEASLRRLSAQLIAFYTRIVLPPPLVETINVSYSD